MEKGSDTVIFSIKDHNQMIKSYLGEYRNIEADFKEIDYSRTIE